MADILKMAAVLLVLVLGTRVADPDLISTAPRY